MIRRQLLKTLGAIGAASIVPTKTANATSENEDPHEYLRENILHEDKYNPRIDTQNVGDDQLWVTYSKGVKSTEKYQAIHDPKITLGSINAIGNRKIVVQYLYTG